MLPGVCRRRSDADRCLSRGRGVARCSIPQLTLFLLVLLASPPAFARLYGVSANETERTASPYFLFQSDDPRFDPAVDTIPLKGTEVRIDIAGVIAHVHVTQTYGNQGRVPINATYVFPGSTRAAVFAMTMTVGKRRLVAEIQERAQARRTYEQAVAAGKTASLLEQQRPNVFQMSVGNVMPGDEILVELDYTELLVPTANVYELVFPTVVGPRYTTARDDGTKRWTNSKMYLRDGVAGPQLPDTAISVHIEAGVELTDVVSPSHALSVKQKRASAADIVPLTTDEDPMIGNRDFILRYRLTAAAIQSGMLTFAGDGVKDEKGDEGEKFFLLMAQPPDVVKPDELPPREYIFILDTSGSMSGFPLDTAKELMTAILATLRDDDMFNVMFFSGDNWMLAPASVEATAGNKQAALQAIGNVEGGGGTELLPALHRALSIKPQQAMARSFVVVTDGYVTVEDEAVLLIHNHRNEANLFAFGIGSSVNRDIIERMARAGEGEPFVVTQPTFATQAAADLARYIESPALANVSLRVDGFDAYDIVPTQIPGMLSERPVVIFGKYRGEARGTIALRALGGKGERLVTVNVGDYPPAKENLALRYLWARHRIDELNEYPDGEVDTVKEITGLGLAYNLMTAYTSFVAVDTEVRNAPGADTLLVGQPLPLPKGVTENALPPAEPAPSFMAATTAGDMGAADSTYESSYSSEEQHVEQSIRTFSAVTLAGEPVAVTLAGSIEVSDPGASRMGIAYTFFREGPRLGRCVVKDSVRGDTSALLSVTVTFAASGLAPSVEIKRVSGGSVSDELLACLAERLRQLLSGEKYRLPEGTTVSVTLSVQGAAQ